MPRPRLRGFSPWDHRFTERLGLAGCGGTSGGASDGPIGVTLIVKTTTNPYFVAMEDGAKADADKAGVKLTLAAGKEDGDDDTQIQAIENAISRGDKGILITPNGPSVINAIEKARDAGLYVIALDTAPDPAEHRRHHLRHRQLRGGRVDRQVDRGAARTASLPSSALSTCSTTRSSRSTTTATRAS